MKNANNIDAKTYIYPFPDKNNHHIDAVRYGMERLYKHKGQ